MLSIGIKNSILLILIILIIHFFLKNIVSDKNAKDRNGSGNMNVNVDGTEDGTQDGTEGKKGKGEREREGEGIESFRDKRVKKNIDPIIFMDGSVTSSNSNEKQEVCRNTRLDDIQLKKIKEDEMMQYVNMGDAGSDTDGNDSNNLDKYFKDNDIENENNSDSNKKSNSNSNNISKSKSKSKDNIKCNTNDNMCKMKVDDNQLPLSTTCNTNIQKLSDNGNMKIHANCELNQDKKNMMILNEYEDEKPMNGGLLYGDLNAFDSFDNNYQSLS